MHHRRPCYFFPAYPYPLPCPSIHSQSWRVYSKRFAALRRDNGGDEASGLSSGSGASSSSTSGSSSSAGVAVLGARARDAALVMVMVTVATSEGSGVEVRSSVGVVGMVRLGGDSSSWGGRGGSGLCHAEACSGKDDHDASEGNHFD